MSVIIRLQNLPWSANALDIRRFFSGLSIPEGGVHIVGGELGDAFIAFSTDEDARQAFNLNGGKIKEVQIKLMLSSRTEMQKVIEAARNPLAAFLQTPQPQATQTLPAIIPAAVPTVVNDLKKELPINEKRDRRRSRSRSRERKERSRERDRRDRRRRDRSRSRSRDRRDRRRRDRSHSRERRDRRSKDRRHSEEKTGSSSNSSLSSSQNATSKVVWEDPIPSDVSPALQQAKVLLNSLLPNNLEDVNLTALSAQALTLARNEFQKQNELIFKNESWSPSGNIISQDNGRPDLNNRFERNFQGSMIDKSRYSKVNVPRSQQSSIEDNSRMPFNKSIRPDGRPSRFEMLPDKNLINRPMLSDRSFPPKRSPNDYSRNCCISLQPFYGGYGEIRRFFHGLFIHSTGIKFVNDDDGKRTGLVYVRFATPEGKEKALLKHGTRLKLKVIDIVEVDDESFDNAIDRYLPEHKSKSNQYLGDDNLYKQKEIHHNYSKPITHYSSLAVEDLPLFTKEQDMLKIFSDYSLLSILLVNKQRHVTAYIKFSNPDDAKKALGEKSHHIFDGKTLNIRPCSDEEHSQISTEDPDVQIIEDDDKQYAISEYISLSGLPLKTTERDISDFFSDVAIVPNKITLVNSHLGFTGQAFCEFSSTNEATIALEKNGLPLGSGIITVTSITRKDMESAIGSTTRPNMNNSLNNPNMGRPFFPRSFGRGGHVPPMLNPRLMGHRPPMRRFMPPNINNGDMAPPGCTILMENVPYKAGLDEILEFFDGFDIPADNVLRRYNENGTPSGEAKVIFNSADEAYQAVQNCNQGKIRDRIVYLSQC